MVKDKGKGEGVKPFTEATDISEIHNDTAKAREAGAKDFSPLRLDKKVASLPSTKIQSRCRSHQIFGATKFGFYPVPCVTRVRIWVSPHRCHPYLLDCC